MAYEVVPYSEAERDQLSAFERIVLEQIEARGDQNITPGDKYNPGATPEPDIWQMQRADGKVEFGNVWQVHRLEVDNRELMYAYRPRTLYKSPEVFKFLARVAGRKEPEDSDKPLPAEAEFYITAFEAHGAVSRTTFREDEEGDISRQRHSRFGNFGVIELRGSLGIRKAKELLTVMEHPEESSVALNAILRLTQRDQRAIAKAHREHEKMLEERRKTLEEIDRAQRVIAPPPSMRYGSRLRAA